MELMCPKCEKTLQNIINAMCEAYAIHEIIYNEIGVPSNYRFLEVNKAFEKMTGLIRENIIGKTVKEIYPEIEAFWVETYGRVATTGQPMDLVNYTKSLDKHFRVSVFSPQKGKFITLFTDITELVKSEELARKHQLLFECAQDAVLYIRDDGKIVDANQSASRLYGYTYDELLSMNLHDIRHISTRKLFAWQMQQADKTGVVFESLHVKKDGTHIPVEVSAKGTCINNENIRIHIIRDITERKKSEDKIIYLANHDFLTGLPNRAYLLDEMDKALHLAERGKYILAVMLFDVDKFKKINDTYGHHAGDIVLKTVAERIKLVTRSTDMIGRLGGDEFIIFQPLIRDEHDVVAMAGRMFQAMEQPIPIGDKQINVSISIGISFYPNDASDRDSLIKAADISMYQAKKESGCSYSIYQNAPKTAASIDE